MDKDLRKILKALEADGYETSRTKKGHIAVYRDGELIATFSGMASDWRSIRNSLAPLKRRGFQWPPKR